MDPSAYSGQSGGPRFEFVRHSTSSETSAYSAFKWPRFLLQSRNPQVGNRRPPHALTRLVGAPKPSDLPFHPGNHVNDILNKTAQNRDPAQFPFRRQRFFKANDAA